MRLSAKPASFMWFVQHELDLSRRDLFAMLSGGSKKRAIRAIFVTIVFVALLHLFAFSLLAKPVAEGTLWEKTGYLTLASFLFLLFCMMASQAIESVTRTFYSRSDLDLVLTAPINHPRLFMVRILAIVLTTSLLSTIIASPVINTLAWLDGPHWLAGYPLIVILGGLATCIALAMTLGLLKVFGARRTRLIAQIVAGIVGAGFMIIFQIIAIAMLGSTSRMELLKTQAVQRVFPDTSNVLWLPVRAFQGDLLSLLLMVTATGIALGLCLKYFAPRLATCILETSSIGEHGGKKAKAELKFRQRSYATVLRLKELKLLIRDKWLLSQIMMQILYLIPPAYLLWQNYGGGNSSMIIITPIVVMASGQIAGGLAWLAISGEDAPQLVSTAPIPRGAILKAKIEAVLIATGIISGPITLGIFLFSPWQGFVCLCFTIIAALSSIMIQFWFRTQANRSNFRRRQTSSKVATICEALSSTFWACTSAVMAASALLAIVPGIMALLVLAIARYFRPDENRSPVFA